MRKHVKPFNHFVIVEVQWVEMYFEGINMAKLMHGNVLRQWIVRLQSKDWGFSSKGTYASVTPAVPHKSSYLNAGVVKISISVFCS